MEILDFEELKDEALDEERIRAFIDTNAEGFVLRLTVERARQYADLTYNYLEAAYIGQECSKYAEVLSYDLNWEIKYHPVADLGLKPLDAEMLAYTIHEFAYALTGDDDNAIFSHGENVEEFRECYNKVDLAFPQLIDEYLANMINGEYYEHDRELDDDEEEDDEEDDFLVKEFKQFPERQFQFWQMASSGNDNIIYVSTETWIIPPGSDSKKALKDHSGVSEIKFEPAEFFAINNISFLISKGLLLHFPFDSFLKARVCSYSALEKPTLLHKNDWIHSMFTYHRGVRGHADTESADYSYHAGLNTGSGIKGIELDFLDEVKTGCEFFVSSFGDQILIKDQEYQYVIWNTDKPKFNELLLLNKKLSEIFLVATKLTGIVADISCPWETLDDERFEELCVDILYHNPSFNSSTIRKMGKSRSRDSGRDIEIWTHGRPHYKPEKYIFQCKLLKPGSSLTAAKLPSISDTVDQFGASGYGVMTNVVIDATLYDKLDRLSINKGITVDDYSVYHLERTLALFPQLRERHFK